MKPCLRRLSEGQGEAPPGPPKTLREDGMRTAIHVGTPIYRVRQRFKKDIG
jgi:hypothetical protein